MALPVFPGHCWVQKPLDGLFPNCIWYTAMQEVHSRLDYNVCFFFWDLCKTKTKFSGVKSALGLSLSRMFHYIHLVLLAKKQNTVWFGCNHRHLKIEVLMGEPMICLFGYFFVLSWSINVLSVLRINTEISKWPCYIGPTLLAELLMAFMLLIFFSHCSLRGSWPISKCLVKWLWSPTLLWMSVSQAASPPSRTAEGLIEESL